MKLVIHAPEIIGSRFSVSYTFNGETYQHAFEAPVAIDQGDAVAVHLIRWLAVVHAIYIFSMGYAHEVETEFPLDEEEARFFEKLFFNGLAELRFVNSIPIDTQTTVKGRANEKSAPEMKKELSGSLLLNGGGKDGLVSSILLDEIGTEYELFQVGRSAAQTRAAKKLAREPIIFRRFMDERWHHGMYKGHRPTSAAIAMAALLTAHLLGKKNVIASNEASANEETLQLDGVTVNHQYSKSYEFEHDLSELLANNGVGVRYFSLLRPLHEIQIVKILTSRPDFAGSFISCNHGFRKGFWCLRCAKCAFIALTLTAVSPQLAEDAMEVTMPINTPELFSHLEALINPTHTKPLECVGTLEECQVAAKLILERNDVPLGREQAALFATFSRHLQKSHIIETLSTLNPTHNLPLEFSAPILGRLKLYLG